MVEKSKKRTSSSSKKTSVKTSSGKSSASSLPKLQKSPLPEDEKFDERSSRSSTSGLSTAWMLILAFAVLATFAVLVWAVLSGREDGKIHGENIEKLKETSEERDASEEE